MYVIDSIEAGRASFHDIFEMASLETLRIVVARDIPYLLERPFIEWLRE